MTYIPYLEVKFRNIIFFLLIAVLTSCGEGAFLDFNKKSKEDATIHYFLTVSEDATFDHISFSFALARAHRKELNQVRTVYLDQAQLNFDLSTPEKIYLGSSTIEPESISGYDLSLGNFKLGGGSEVTDLSLIGISCYSDFQFKPEEGDELDIIFILDVSKSVILDSAGQNWINPKFEIQK